jgi:predicted small lipoprotein YifL
MQHRNRLILLLLLTALIGSAALLAGCGQKGPLYLPDEAPQSGTEKPAAAE